MEQNKITDRNPEKNSVFFVLDSLIIWLLIWFYFISFCFRAIALRLIAVRESHITTHFLLILISFFFQIRRQLIPQDFLPLFRNKNSVDLNLILIWFGFDLFEFIVVSWFIGVYFLVAKSTSLVQFIYLIWFDWFYSDLGLRAFSSDYFI